MYGLAGSYAYRVAANPDRTLRDGCGGRSIFRSVIFDSGKGYYFALEWRVRDPFSLSEAFFTHTSAIVSGLTANYPPDPGTMNGSEIEF